MTRRKFMQAVAATGAMLAIPVRAALRRSPIRVEGPTPPELIKGVPGVSYFKAAVHDHPGIKVYLDGAEVNHRANECDTVAGWVRMYDVNPDGSFVVTGDEWLVIKNGKQTSTPMQAIQRIHFGKVEVR